MIRRPSRIVIAQAIVVGLLVVIVSITLLGPEENTPLSGIETPGERVPRPPGGDAGQRDDAEGGRRGDREGDRGRGGDRQGTGDAGPPVASGVAGSESPAGVAPPAADDGGDAGSPTDDQYADTLTRLAERLN